MDTFVRLIEGLGNLTGIDGLAPEEDGGCSLMFDEFTVHMLADEEKGTLMVFSPLMPIPATDKERFFARLLRANAFYADTFGADFCMRDDVVYLQQLASLRHMSEQEFFSLLETFLRTLGAWHGILTEPDEAPLVGGPQPAHAPFA